MPVVHIVALKFKADLTEERIAEHFTEEVNLKTRMPELVIDWHWSKNLTLETRSECNRGMQYVVMVTVADLDALDAYLKHPQHVEVGTIQGPLLEDKFVIDVARD